MSHNLTLGRKQKSEKKGGKSTYIEFPLRQTPTVLTRECEPFLAEKWKVFDRYATWCRTSDFHYLETTVGSPAWKEANSYLDEHLNAVRKALDEGCEWSWI